MRTKSNSGKFSFLAEQSQRPPRQSQQQQQHSKNKSTKNLENYHKIHSHQQKNFVNKQPPQPQRTEPKKKKNKNQLDVESEIVYLEHHWSFWFDRYIGPNRSVEEYQSALVELTSVDNIQEFWRWYNHLPAVNQLQPGTSYHLMKTGVRPLWEDENNVNGGELTLKVKKSETLYVWEQLLLAVVGEQIVLENNDEICGLSVSIRKTSENVISLWNKNQNVKLDSLVEQMKNLLPEIRVDNPTYKVHSVLMNSAH